MMGNSSFIIVPHCSDMNRGDQALVWETKTVAEKAGYIGDFFIVGDASSQQTIHEGIGVLDPVLKHPGRNDKKSNLNYNMRLKIKWGLSAVYDMLKSQLLIVSGTCKFAKLFYSKREWDTVLKIKHCSAVFVKGGGFIHSYGKLTDSYTVYFNLFHIRLALRFGKSVFVMPNSFGPFSGPLVKHMVQSTFRRCKYVCTRESISREMLSKIGVKNHLIPDLGFSLCKSLVPGEFTNLQENISTRKIVAITVRPYRYPTSSNISEKQNQYILAISDFAKYLYMSGYYPVFVEQVIAKNPHAHESDMRAILEITSGLLEGEYAILSNTSWSCRQLKAIYASCYCVVGTRFHSVIFALSEGVRALAISYGGNKGEGILKDIGLSEYCIPIEQLDFNRIKGAFEALVSDSKYETTIRNYTENIETEYRTLIDAIKHTDSF